MGTIFTCICFLFLLPMLGTEVNISFLQERSGSYNLSFMPLRELLCLSVNYPVPTQKSPPLSGMTSPCPTSKLVLKRSSADMCDHFLAGMLALNIETVTQRGRSSLGLSPSHREVSHLEDLEQHCSPTLFKQGLQDGPATTMASGRSGC